MSQQNDDDFMFLMMTKTGRDIVGGAAAITLGIFAAPFVALYFAYEAFPNETAVGLGGTLLTLGLGTSDWVMRPTKEIRNGTAPISEINIHTGRRNAVFWTGGVLTTAAVGLIAWQHPVGQHAIPDFITRHPQGFLAGGLATTAALYAKTLNDHKLKIAAVIAGGTLALGAVGGAINNLGENQKDPSVSFKNTMSEMNRGSADVAKWTVADIDRKSSFGPLIYQAQITISTGFGALAASGAYLGNSGANIGTAVIDQI
ncbi:MAG TPA: hypothetical protein VFR09_01500, partial [Alphaproteobacteria bacterium]|nr:hypothetical protein [Alphaproteobacteria bacterium]